MEYVLATTVIIGAVELIKRLFDRDYRSATIITVAALVGGLLGAFSVEGLTIAAGLALGLGASGVVTVAQNVKG